MEPKFTITTGKRPELKVEKPAAQEPVAPEPVKKERKKKNA